MHTRSLHPSPGGTLHHSGRRVSVIRSATASRSKPVWTGDSIPSRLANWAINTPWMFSLMKLLAKNQMKSTASRNGVDWDGHVSKLQAISELEVIKGQLERKDIKYPDYYLKPFHAYDEGNLNWLAAYEVEPASYAVALRAFGKMFPNISPKDAHTRMVGGATDALKAYYGQHGLAAPKFILDVGCSTGMSTRWVAEQYPEADVTGLDLSPYFLAVAEWEERQRRKEGRKTIKYVHGLFEESGLPAESVDMLLFQYVIHECPQKTIRDFIAEGARIVKPGGTLTFVDNNPRHDPFVQISVEQMKYAPMVARDSFMRSKTIQGLPPAVATLSSILKEIEQLQMKSTEPWSDEYFSFDVEAAMREGGFKEVVQVEIDHRHRAVMGIK